MGSYKLKIIGLAVAITACSVVLIVVNQQKRQFHALQQRAQVPTVAVLTMRPQNLALTTELPGRTLASLTAEIRPQVGGLIKKQFFTEGTLVKAGEPLYQIEPALYEAAYQNAQALLLKAEAINKAAQLKAKRYAKLVQIQAVSKQANDEIQATAKQAQADIIAAQANLAKAKVNLEFTTLTAPITGYIGRSLVTVGALVTANQPSSLAVVQQLDPIYIDITQPSKELAKIALQGPATVQLNLENGQRYPLSGHLNFAETTVDRTTGCVILRATFPNPDRQLLPGTYVNALISRHSLTQAFLVPQEALTFNHQGQAVVMVVNQANKVEPRIVGVDSSKQQSWVVTSGLQAGDRIVVEGFQQALPGSPVKPEEVMTATPSQATLTKE